MPQGTNIVNLDQDVPPDEKELVQARINKNIFNYLFRGGVLVGERGPRQALIVHFFHRLHEACLPVFGPNPRFDFDNEGKLNEILQRLNFNEPVQRPAVSRKGKK